MFYKYPDEFIVPVIYTNDLSFKENDGYRNITSLREEDRENGILLDEENGEKIFESFENTNESEGRIGILNEPSQKDGIPDNSSSDDLEYNELNDMLNEIDNEYAKSEIGIV